MLLSPFLQGEPFAEEAIAFTREHALQRDAEVVIETMDRGGTFLGNITILGAGPQVSRHRVCLPYAGFLQCVCQCCHITVDRRFVRTFV